MRNWLAILGFVGLTLVTASSALAQEGEGDSPSDERATTFQAVTGPQKEDVPGGALLVSAYGAVLVLLIGYSIRLAKLHADNAREIRELKQALDQGKKS